MKLPGESELMSVAEKLYVFGVAAAGVILLAAFVVYGHSDAVTVSLAILGFLAGGVRIKLGATGTDRETGADAGWAVIFAAAIACGPIGAVAPAAMTALGRAFLTADEREPFRNWAVEVGRTEVRAAILGLVYLAAHGSIGAPGSVGSLLAASVAAIVFFAIDCLVHRRIAIGSGAALSLALGYVLGCSARAVPSYVVLMPALPAGASLLRLLIRSRKKNEATETVEPEPVVDAKPAFIDPVTGLANGRYLEMFLQQEISRSERHGYEMTVLLLDIDDFDSLNSENGSEDCNRCMEALGSSFRGMLRDYDVVARYKDDEFVIVLPEMDVHTGSQIAERIHAEVSGHILPLRARFSVGVAAYPIHGATIDTLLDSAHHALHRAKFSGKNRVRSCHELAKAS